MNELSNTKSVIQECENQNFSKKQKILVILKFFSLK